MIPDLIKKMLNGQYPLEILGSGKQVRCYTHVSDLADGIITVMESRKAANEVFNIANPDPIFVDDLAKKIWKIHTAEKTLKIKHMKGFQFDIQKRIPDTTKMRKLLGWKTKVAFDDGLQEVYNWVKNVYEKK